MVEADSHLKLLPASILDIFKVFGHVDMLSIGIWYSKWALPNCCVCFAYYDKDGLFINKHG